MSPSVDFSGFAAEYAASRPQYPRELFEWLASTVTRHDAAWDVATGNGQAAVGLAAHFDRVIATDVSPEQLSHATRHPRIEYRVAAAETSGLAPGSVELVTVAAALHWLDLDRFYDEVHRVVRSRGVFAAWTYHVAHVGPPLGDVLGPFYDNVVSPYFAPEARWVDKGYADLPVPGEPLDPPPFRVSVRWSVASVLAFVRTWSGVQSYIAAVKRDPVVELETPLRVALGGDAPVDLSFPLYVRATRV